MTNTNKKQSAKQKRVLIASVLLAGMIVAGGTFAWFTSKDEVTNKLTASGGYGVSIIEDFTPPENWYPGEDVDKDVYVVNTGNIAAFVRVSLSNTLNLNTKTTGDIIVSTGKISYNISNAVKLSDTQVEAIQAGGRVVCIAGEEPSTTTKEIEQGTDFKPTDPGLYVFEGNYEMISGDVTTIYVSDNSDTTSVSSNDLTFSSDTTSIGADGNTVTKTATCSGYYFDGTSYYAVDNITYTTDKTTNAKTWSATLVQTTPSEKDMTFDYSDRDNNTVTATYTDSNGKKIVIDIKLVDGWQDNWDFVSTTTDDGGTFYYKSILKPGTESDQLVESVEFVSCDFADYYDFDYELTITADSVQVANGTDEHPTYSAETLWNVNANLDATTSKYVWTSKDSGGGRSILVVIQTQETNDSS